MPNGEEIYEEDARTLNELMKEATKYQNELFAKASMSMQNKNKII